MNEQIKHSKTLNTDLNSEAIVNDSTAIDKQYKQIWNIDEVERELISAYEANSEKKLLAILKDNSFLFYDLFLRKYAIQPIFRELSFSGDFRCDFAWLNDNSSGPEWVLVEVERPKLKLFKSDGKPTAYFNAAIEQVKNWDQHFRQHPSDMKKIFGAVARFRFILVVGTADEWQTEHAQKWRIYHHQTSSIEIKSIQTFFRSIAIIRSKPEEFWSFEERPSTLSHSKLKEYWQNYGYMDRWRQIL